jgi:hypothetical protein
MSSVEVAKIYDERVMVGKKREYAVLKGAEQYSYIRFPASSTNTRTIQYTIYPSSVRTFVNRKMYQRWFCQFDFTASGATTGTLLQMGASDGLRQMPISSCMSQVTCQIAGQGIATPLNSYIKPLLHYKNGLEQQDYDYSMSPGQADQTQYYDDWTGSGSSGNVQAGGSSRNVLAYYGENSTQASRGAFPYVSVTNPVYAGATGTAQVKYELAEPLLISPLAFGRGDVPSFVGLDQIQLQIQNGIQGLNDPLAYMWSHANNGNSAWATPVVSFYQVPEVLCMMMTPDQTMSIPPVIDYPYYKYTLNSQDLLACAPNTSYSLSLNNQQLPGVPHRLLVWVERKQSTRNCLSTDTFAAISNLSIQFDNRPSVLATATQQDLYQIAVKNGLCMSYPQFISYQGSPILINPATDLGLPADQSDGSFGARNLQITMSFKNPCLSGANIDYTANCLVIQEGVFTISNLVGSTIVNPLSPTEVLSAESSMGPDAMHLTQNNKGSGFHGGSFFGDVWDGIKTVLKPVSQVANATAPLWGSFAPELLPVAKVGQSIFGSGKHKKAHKKGGAMLSREELSYGL